MSARLTVQVVTEEPRAQTQSVLLDVNASKATAEMDLVVPVRYKFVVLQVSKTSKHYKRRNPITFVKYFFQIIFEI